MPTPARVTLPPQVVPAQNVGRLFPLITPSPVAAPAPVATPSSAAPRLGQASQARPRAPVRGQELALSQPVTGSRQIGLVFIVFLAAGTAAWLLLRKTRKRRVP